jgi:membrane protein
VMIERLFGYGEDISSLAALESDMAMWKDIDIVNAEFIEKGKQIAF